MALQENPVGVSLVVLMFVLGILSALIRLLHVGSYSKSVLYVAQLLSVLMFIVIIALAAFTEGHLIGSMPYLVRAIGILGTVKGAFELLANAIGVAFTQDKKVQEVYKESLVISILTLGAGIVFLFFS